MGGLPSDKEGAYGEPLGEIVFGVRCGEVEVQTRLHVWSVVDVPGKAAEFVANPGNASDSSLGEGLASLESCQ